MWISVFFVFVKMIFIVVVLGSLFVFYVLYWFVRIGCCVEMLFD